MGLQAIAKHDFSRRNLVLNAADRKVSADMSGMTKDEIVLVGLSVNTVNVTHYSWNC